jgi:hypothetical protein
VPYTGNQESIQVSIDQEHSHHQEDATESHADRHMHARHRDVLTVEDLEHVANGKRPHYIDSSSEPSSLANPFPHSAWTAGDSHYIPLTVTSGASSHDKNQHTLPNNNGSSGARHFGREGSSSGDSSEGKKMTKDELRAWKMEQAEKARRKMQDLQEKLTNFKGAARVCSCFYLPVQVACRRERCA